MGVKNFNVGPSQLYGSVDIYLSEVIQNQVITVPHRSEKFSEIYRNTQTLFRSFYNIPDNYKVFFCNSATEAMDIVMLGSSSEESTHVSNGVFGNLFIQAGENAGKTLREIKSDNSTRVSLEKIIDIDTTLVITANETSTGMQYNSLELEQIRNNNRQSTLLIDATSSFGAIDYNIACADAWIFSVQKCLGLPSGLGMIVVSDDFIEQARKKKESGGYIGGYNSLLQLEKFDQVGHTIATPNTLLIMGLGYICEEYKLNFGNISELDKITKQKAKYFYSEIEKIDNITVYCDGEGKSDTTFVLELSPDILQEKLKKIQEYGYSVSPGLFELSGKVMRIANFPVHSQSDIEKFIELLK